MVETQNHLVGPQFASPAELAEHPDPGLYATPIGCEEPTAWPPGATARMARHVNETMIEDAAAVLENVADAHRIAPTDVIESAVIEILEELRRQMQGT